MKSKIVDNAKDTTYPMLMKYIRGDETLIVLFQKPYCGMVVNIDGTSKSFIGKYQENWNMENFKPFNKSVILQN